jgi:hypothetical protein
MALRQKKEASGKRQARKLAEYCNCKYLTEA